MLLCLEEQAGVAALQFCNFIDRRKATLDIKLPTDRETKVERTYLDIGLVVGQQVLKVLE